MMKAPLVLLFLFGILNAFALTDKHEEESVASSDQAIKFLKRSAKKYGWRPRLANRIIRGQEAQEHSLPWMVSNRINNTHICGGSLIREDIVLTTTRCLNLTRIAKKFGVKDDSEEDLLPLYELVLGDHDVSTTDPWEQKFSIANFVALKPDTNRKGVNLVNDIAVVKLDRKANINRNVSTIPLSDSSIKVSPGDKLTVAGWGLSKRPIYDAKLEHVTYPEKFSNVLKVAETMVIKREDCANYIPYTYVRRNKTRVSKLGHPAGEDMICTGEYNFQGNTVDGDSGSPLMYYDNTTGKYLQVGVRSYGVGRSGENGYSSVNYFSDDIKDMIHELDNLQNCGNKPSLASRIIKGKEVEANSWPWAVAIRTTPNDPLCGGSLISKEFVMTAGHCVRWLKSYPDWIPKIEVYLGDHTLNITEAPEQVFGITDFRAVYIDENKEGVPLFNDLGLIKLNGTAKINKYVSPICLPKSPINLSQGDKLTVVGWGKYKHTVYDAKVGLKHPGPFSNVLKEAEVMVIKNEDCANYYNPKDEYGNEIPFGQRAGDDLICTREKYGEGKIIHGDSGSPLMYYDSTTSRYVQVGVVSYGHGRIGEVAHARVAHFIKDIKKWVKEMGTKLYGRPPFGLV